MHLYNILIGVDQKYYTDWGENLLKSINYHNPWIALHCHIVNPHDFSPLPFVDYTFENRIFENDDSRIAYLQAVRFLKVADKFLKNEYVITLDADSVCTRAFGEEEFSDLFKHTTVLKHPKGTKWLACLVSFNSSEFRYDFANELKKEPVSEWKFGRDQHVLKSLNVKYNYHTLDPKWVSIGKNKQDSIFLTLKGEQKETEKYLDWYKKYI